MADVSNPEKLKKEIEALTAENAELKQRLQLLRDHQDPKSSPRSLCNEIGSSFLPAHEPPRLDGQDHFGAQLFVDSSSFTPTTSFRPTVLQCLNSTSHLPTTPMTLVGAGPVFVGQPPLPSSRLDSVAFSPPTSQMVAPPQLFPGAVVIGHSPEVPRAPRMQFQLAQFQSPPVARLNLRSSPPNLLHIRGPSTPDSAMQGPVGYLSSYGSSQEFSPWSYSTPGRLRGRGYCWECAIPLHPHLPHGSLADSALSGTMNQRGSSSDGSAQTFPPGSAVLGSLWSAAAAAADSSYGPGSPLSSPRPPGLPFLGAPQFPPAGAAFSPAAARPLWPASPQDAPASFGSGPSSQGGHSFPHTPPQGPVPSPPDYMQSFSPSSLAPQPEMFSPPPTGKILPSSAGAPTLETLGPQSPAPAFTFPSSLQSTPTPPQAKDTKVPPQTPPPTPPELKTKAHGESKRQATSVTMKKSSKDSKQLSTERIVGEIAFQLDRRILSAIFPNQVRLYGFTVSNILEKISQNGSEGQLGLTEDQRRSTKERYDAIMGQLKTLGYDPSTHPEVTEKIVNTYGILRERPDTRGTEADLYNNIEYLRNIVQNTVPADKRDDCMMLLTCLQKMSEDDGKPLFIW